jgi:hypothetical protein
LLARRSYSPQAAPLRGQPSARFERNRYDRGSLAKPPCARTTRIDFAAPLAHPDLADGQRFSRVLKPQSKPKGEPMTDTKTLSLADLAQFTGSECFYRHPIVRVLFYTEGVQFLAEKGGAFWLIDEIAFSQRLRQVTALPSGTFKRNQL